MVRSCSRKQVIVLLLGVSKVRHSFLSIHFQWFCYQIKTELGHGNPFLREHDFITVKPFISILSDIKLINIAKFYLSKGIKQEFF